MSVAPPLSVWRVCVRLSTLCSLFISLRLAFSAPDEAPPPAPLTAHRQLRQLEQMHVGKGRHGRVDFPGVKRRWLHEANIVRVDRCQFSNLTHDSAPPEGSTSLLRVHQPFFWAWHGGECNGLQDKKWAKSGGAELIGALRADAVRLLRLGVLTASQRAAGSVAIDIGAHSGDSTLPMAMLANRTIAFDPNPDVFNILRVNAKINPHLHIDAHPLAIADADKNLTFQYGWRVPANAQSEFRCNGGVSGVGGRTLPQLWVTKRAVQLEGFLRRSYGDDIVPRVKYIKIDAEGFDSSILRSLYGLIAVSRPAIQVEYFDQYEMENAKMVREGGGGGAQSSPVGAASTSSKAHYVLSPGAVRLFEAIRDIPGAYRVYCTYQCNEAANCRNSELLEPVTVSPKGVSPIEAYMVKQRRGDQGSATSNAAKEAVKCADLMLLPVEPPK